LKILIYNIRIGPLSTEQKEKKTIVKHARENKNSVNLKKPQEVLKIYI